MKAAIYCRLSEEDRNKQNTTDDSNSIKNQKALLLQYAINQGWEIYGIYSDDDYSGSDRNRPQFNKMIEDAQENKFDIILCKSQSRFTRELELVEKYINGLFIQWGIRFISIVDNVDTNIKSNKKARQINGLINEWYLEDMSENIKSVLNYRRANGFHIGSFALYGYKKDEENKGRLIVDENAAKVVREIFELYTKGYGKTAIAKLLNIRGEPNPTEYKRLNGLKYNQPNNSKLWSYHTVSQILKNEMYIGNMVQGKYGSDSYKTKKSKPKPEEEWYKVEGTHQAIIDNDLWNKAHQLQNKSAKPNSKGKIGIFARKVYCANCARLLCSHQSRGRRYLRCPTRLVSKQHCEGCFVSEEKLEKAVIEQLNIICSENSGAQRLSDLIYKEKSVRGNQESRYIAKYRQYSNALKQLYLDRVNGNITKEEYVSLFKELSKDKQILESVVTDEQYAISNIKILNREMVDELIEKIVVDRSLDNIVDIYWKF